MRRFGNITALPVIVAISVTAVWAGLFTTDFLNPVSSPSSPLAACTADDVAGQVGTNFLNSVVEPSIEVNPTNSLNIVAGFQQDRWSNGGARGLLASVSTDGGITQFLVVIPRVVVCAGGTAANCG